MIKNVFTLPDSDPFLKACLNNNPWLLEYTARQPETGRNPNETDRGGWRGYDRVYSKFLSEFKNEPLKILEIGVHSGYGVLAWLCYFQNSKVYGAEIEFNKWISSYNSLMNEFSEFRRSNIFQMDSTLSSDWVRCIDTKFDVIIDDGSHLPNDQIATLSSGWKYLKSGGYYFIEDISSRYSKPSKKDVFDYLKKLEGVKLLKIYSHHNIGWSNILSNPSVWNKYGVTEDTPLEFEDYIAVIQKE